MKSRMSHDSLAQQRNQQENKLGVQQEVIVQEFLLSNVVVFTEYEDAGCKGGKSGKPACTPLNSCFLSRHGSKYTGPWFMASFGR